MELSAEAIDELERRKLKRIKRQRVVKNFFLTFIFNFTFSSIGVVYGMYENWVVGDMGVSRCHGSLGRGPGVVHDLIFLAQVISQAFLVRHAPIDIMSWLGGRESPFSGSSRHKFYSYWWGYIIITAAQLFVDLRILLTCGVECDEFCFQHVAFTVFDWVCLLLNFIFIGISWSPSFRKSFPVFLEFDSTLGNPASWDIAVKQSINCRLSDASGHPISLHGVEFECILINYADPFQFDEADFEEEDKDENDDEMVSLIPAWRRAQLNRHLFVVEDEGTVLTLENSKLSNIPFALQRSPHIVRIGISKCGLENHGMLQFDSSRFNIPPSLLVPEDSILRVRPMHEKDRDIIPLQNGPFDINVVGNTRDAPMRNFTHSVDIMISHNESTADIAKELGAFLRSKFKTVFIAAEESGTDNLNQVIADHCKRANYFVMLMDVAWLRSKENRYELSIASDMSMKRHTPVLVPVLLGGGDFWKTVKFFPSVEGMLTHINGVTMDASKASQSYALIWDNITSLEQKRELLTDRVSSRNRR